MRIKSVLPIMFVVVLLISMLYVAPHGVKAQLSEFSTWTFLDSSDRGVELLGEEVGKGQGQPFTGWYTDTVVVDPDSGIVVIAWARSKADGTNDYIFIAFLKPVDADGDGKPEAYQKIVRYVDKGRNVTLDSLTLGKVGDRKYVLLTWTYYRDDRYRNDVRGAVYDVNGEFEWKGTIRGTTYYEEYSRSCYVPKYNEDRGGFLIIWYTSYDKSIDGKWLYYDGEWRLSSRIDIADTNGLYFNKADQMLCIGGRSKALVVYRVWDDSDGDDHEVNTPDLWAVLVDVTNGPEHPFKLYDYDGAEETIGVRGAYVYYNGEGYFLVPLLSGTYVRYDVVRESDGYVWHRDYVTRNGEHPYAIALNDRFVLAWIDHYRDSDGEPKVANIDLNDFYIHPQYGVSITGGDSYTDKHPLTAYSLGDGRLLYVWSSKRGDGYDVEYAVVNLYGPEESPKVEYVGTLISDVGDQVAHGLGLTSLNQLVVAYTDTSDGEEDLMAYMVFPDIGYIGSINVFQLPRDSIEFVSELVDIIRNARDRAHVVIAYWDLDVTGKEILDAVSYARDNGVDVGVVLDNSTRNSDVEGELRLRKIPFINDSRATEPNHIMHEKFVVADDSLVVLTANFGNEVMHDNNTAIVFRDAPTLTYFFDKEFKQLMRGYFGTSKNYDFSFIALMKEPSIGLMAVEGYFSPVNYGMKDKIPSTILGYINRTEIGGVIGFTSYIFTTSGYVYPIYKAIVAKQHDVKVYLVFDEGMNLDVPGRIIYWFADNRTLVWIDTHRFSVHSKLFVMFNERNNYYVSILGSWNPTKTATVNNDEDIIIVRELVDNPNNARVSSEFLNYVTSLLNKAKGVNERYDPPHPVISRASFKPDESGNPKYEWVEVYNPTSYTIDLSNYVIGDAEDLLHGDDESLYKFPVGARVRPNDGVIIAYNATAFHEIYGLYPDYEIVDSNATIPNLIPYDTSRFTGSWDLSDDGDEVILAVDEGEGFLRVVDAVWYGNSDYMNTSLGRPRSAEPLDISGWQYGYGIVDRAITEHDNLWDALRMNDKYTLMNLSNTPAKLSLSLVAVNTLKAHVHDPDGGASISRVRVGSKVVSGDTVNLDSLGLEAGVYDLTVEGFEETPIGTAFRSHSIPKGLGVIDAPNGQKLYVFAEEGGIRSVAYDYLSVDLHRIVVLGTIKGGVNVTVPEFWDTSSVRVYADGAQLAGVTINGRMVLVKLSTTVSNLTITGETPGNVNASLKAVVRGMGSLDISAVDPDGANGYMWLKVLVNGSTLKVLKGSGSLSYTLSLDTTINAVYNVTLDLIERTPSYINLTRKLTLWVAIIPSRTFIVSNGSVITSYRYVVINSTHSKVEVILSGPKVMVNLSKPSEWVRVIKAYYNGLELGSGEWGVSDGVVWVDPGDGNVTVLGGKAPGGTVTATALPSGYGGFLEPYTLVLIVALIITTITVVVTLIART